MRTLNHSSQELCNYSSAQMRYVSTMVEYSDRLREAMEDAGYDPTSLAKHLRVSYQAVKKVLDGKSNAFNAINHAEAARLLNVSSDWLALGDVPKTRSGGEPVGARESWPFKRTDISRLSSLPEGDLSYLEGRLAEALSEIERGAATAKVKNR
ncbi:helix-turn-helix transcriptional regulator [Bordetella bronchialis]|uniref:helix-turn-helix transcriptional regulator n=1 Tax=Bordetella bronchialis TaxID=463025 RepID=UPI0012EAA698|nr:helix-turn-helix transcriptional regulator [Bordetella bronchialis]